MKILVIGACNIDIVATSEQPIVEHDSNIGTIQISLGGVAKNIATNLHYLNSDIHFLTLIGNDGFTELQRLALDEIGLDYHQSFVRDVVSSTYVSVHDSDGEMVTAVNDMRAFELLGKTDFESIHNYIEAFDMIVMDTNLSEAALNYLIKEYQNKMIIIDGVSQSKVTRVKHLLPYIDLLKVNLYELNSLLEVENCDIIKGVKRLYDLGLKTCLVSSSDHPIVYNVKDEIHQSNPYQKTNIVSTLGAGDALLAGTIYQLANGKNMHDAVNFGKIVASKTLEVVESCNKNIVGLIDL